MKTRWPILFDDIGIGNVKTRWPHLLFSLIRYWIVFIGSFGIAIGVGFGIGNVT